jgi:hypothetical protein
MYFVLQDDGPFICYRCNHQITGFMMLNTEWLKGYECQTIKFCRQCMSHINKRSPTLEIDDYKLVGIVPHVANTSIPVLPKKPELVPGRVTTLSQAAKLPSERTVNRAWRSKDTNFMIDEKARTPEQIEENNRLLLEEAAGLEKSLNESQFLDKMLEIGNSQPLIEHEERKFLGGKMQLELTKYPFITEITKRKLQSNSQCQRILEKLRSQDFVSSAELRLFAYQYNTRIFELRKGFHDGIEHKIKSVRDKKGRTGYTMEVK